MARITLDMLTRACQDQQDLFADLFPDGVEVTEELCREHAEEFNWHWAAGHLLSMSGWKEYRLAVGCAYERYNFSRRTVVAKCGSGIDIARRLSYRLTLAAAWHEYNMDKAVAFAQAFNSQPESS